MPDLTLTQLRQAYDAALGQIAAESFLEGGMSGGRKRGHSEGEENGDILHYRAA